MDRFIWQPGKGLDSEALVRLRGSFRRPSEPMGEAWFMGERRFFPELSGDLALLSVSDLQTPLEEIASGTGSFGPMPEWNAWYHYLLAQLLPRNHEAFVTPLLEILITGFMALYPNGVGSSAYRGFRDDALLTLGSCLMDEQCWQGNEVNIGTFLHRSDNNPNHVWCWWDASGDFSASMFFCLKYLHDSRVTEWLQSVLAISSPHWRAQVIVWLVGAHDLLTGQARWPSDFHANARPSIAWDWSHCLRPDLATADVSGLPAMDSLLSEGARAQVLQIVHAYFSEDVYLEWITSISRVPYLEVELAEIPSTFEALYIRSH
jgi:hypothetical protein